MVTFHLGGSRDWLFLASGVALMIVGWLVARSGGAGGAGGAANPHQLPTSAIRSYAAWVPARRSSVVPHSGPSIGSVGSVMTDPSSTPPQPPRGRRQTRIPSFIRWGGLAVALVALLLYGGYQYLLTTPWGPSLTLFADGHRTEHFQAMDRVFPSVPIRAGADIRVLIPDERPIPARCPFPRATHTPGWSGPGSQGSTTSMHLRTRECWPLSWLEPPACLSRDTWKPTSGSQPGWSPMLSGARSEAVRRPSAITRTNTATSTICGIPPEVIRLRFQWPAPGSSAELAGWFVKSDYLVVEIDAPLSYGACAREADPLSSRLRPEAACGSGVASLIAAR